MNELLPIFIDHGILGIIVLFAGYWIKIQNREAKKEREGLQSRIFDLIEKTNQFDAKTGHELKELRNDVNRLTDRLDPGKRR